MVGNDNYFYFYISKINFLFCFDLQLMKTVFIIFAKYLYFCKIKGMYIYIRTCIYVFKKILLSHYWRLLFLVLIIMLCNI